MSAAFTQGILIKALCAFPLEEVQPLKGVEHLPLIYSELCCQGVNACVCCPVADGKARPATALTAQAGDKTALLSVSCSPQGNRDVECVHALSVFPHPQPLIYYHTHRLSFHQRYSRAFHLLLFDLCVRLRLRFMLRFALQHHYAYFVAHFLCRSIYSLSYFKKETPIMS